MGIKGFAKLFENYGEEINLEIMENGTIAIDAYNMIYRAMLAQKSIQSLTDSKGNTTVHINTIFNQILMFKKFNIKQIWVFDGEPYAIKNKELERRSKGKEKARKQIEEIEKNEKNEEDEEKEKRKIKKEKLEKQTFILEEKYTDDVKDLLDLFHIDWIQARHEADPICARLVCEGIADAVLTTDADMFLYGCNAIVKPFKKKSKTGKSSKSVYMIYSLITFLKKIGINRDQLIDIALHLGTDYAHKTPRISATTILKKLDSLELNEEQQEAKRYILKQIKKNNMDNNESKFTKYAHEYISLTDKDMKRITNYLINKNFNEERIVEKLNEYCNTN